MSKWRLPKRRLDAARHFDCILLATLVAITTCSFSFADSGPSKDEILDWCRDFSSTGSLRFKFEYRGIGQIAESENPSPITERGSLSIRWPDAMILDTTLRRSDRFEAAELRSRDGSFIRIFRPDATVSASTYGEAIVVSSRAVLFFEEAWRYCHHSPWIVAQMISSEHSSSLRFHPRESSTQVDIAASGVSATFTKEEDGIRLVQLRVQEAEVDRDTVYKYSDFRAGGPKGRSFPQSYSVRGKFKIIDRRSGTSRSSEPRDLGTGTIMSCEWPESIPNSAFEFPPDIAAATTKAGRRQNSDANLNPKGVASPDRPHRSSAKQAPSSREANSSPTPDAREVPWIALLLAGIGSLGIAFGILRIVKRL
ncbi:MAG: hypothetical protein ACK58T_31460 [Phycisphaerae bacterium]